MWSLHGEKYTCLEHELNLKKKDEDGYYVTYEMFHLIELNHSPIWSCTNRIYVEAIHSCIHVLIMFIDCLLRSEHLITDMNIKMEF